MIKLVQHLLALPVQDISLIAPQDMALCSLWNDVAVTKASSLDGLKHFPRHLEMWLANAPGDRPSTEGRRHQSLLRELVLLVQSARITMLARDELDFLARTRELVLATANSKAFSRVEELITPHIKTIESRREYLSPDLGLKALTERLQVVSSEDIQLARASDTKTLAGVALPSRGPVFRRNGQLRVLGDVPEGCTVIVENGDCVVDGFVLGRVAATNSCEVRDNIVGAVVVRDGDIRARAIINNATAIAKTGRIYCRATQSPRLIFSGSDLEVKGDALQGNYIAPSIQIEGEAFGGQYDITRQVESARFKCTDARPLTIIFRKGLSCRDYGEAPGKEMSRALSKALRLRRSRAHGLRTTQLAAREAEQFASSALMYILGGDKIKKNLADTLAAQRRLDVLSRIISGMRFLYTAAQEHLEARQSNEGIAREGTEEFQSSLSELMSDFPELQGEDPLDSDLVERKAHVLQLKNDLSGAIKNPAFVAKILIELEDNLREWFEEAKTLATFIQSNEKRLHESVGWKHLKALEGENVIKVTALRQVVKAAENLPRGDAVAMRAQSTFVRLMLRNIRTRLSLARSAREILRKTQIDFEKARTEVWNKFQVRVEDNESDEMQETGIAKGRYDAHINLYADASFLESESIPEGRHLITPGHGDEEVTYACKAGVITKLK